MNHWLNEGKEILRQGRSKKQVEGSNKGCFVSGVGLFLVIMILIVANLL